MIPHYSMVWRERTFKWKFKHFKKAMKGHRLKRYPNQDDLLVMTDMAVVHGGKYWPTTDGGLVALPYGSRKFDFNEWLS